MRHRGLTGTAVPVLLAVLTVWLLVCTHIAGVIPVKEIVSRIAVPVMVYMCSAAVFVLSGLAGRTVIFVLLCIFTLFEAAVGAFQLIGWFPPNNPYFILDGNFVNQGLFGGFMSITATACLYAFIRLKQIWCRAAVAVVFLVAFVMMCMSVSRAAWLGFVVAAVVILHREAGVRLDFSRKTTLIAACVFVIALCAGIYVIKPESAIGRLHIWRMDCRTIMEHPMVGVGSAAEAGAYGDAQEHFFASADRSSLVKRIADGPQFVFNEFLKFGIQGGVPALVLSVAVYLLALLLLWRKSSGSVYLFIAFGVFSLFSFPLFSVTLSCILAVLLADASVTEGKGRIFWPAAALLIVAAAVPPAAHRIRVMQVRKEWRYEPDESRHFGKYYPELRYDQEFINIYADLLYKSGHFSKAFEVLSEAEPFNSGALYLCLKGSCQMSMGEFDDAQKSFRRAMNRIPTRLTPYLLMIEYYNSLGFTPIAGAYRDRALSLPCDTTLTETARVRRLIEAVPLD